MCFLCALHPCTQAFSGDTLDQKVASKQVNLAAITALLNQLATKPPEAAPATDHAWVAGPVIGGVAGAALLAGVVWYLVKRNQQPRVPVSFNAAGTDAAARVRRVADKYAVREPEGTASDGGTPHSAAQVGPRVELS